MADPNTTQPTPPDGQNSLSDQSENIPRNNLCYSTADTLTVNIATRAVHTQLNRLILARLPLALPPFSTNPSIYVSGLLYIAPIYITFESLWQSIIDAPNLPICLEESRISPGGESAEGSDSDYLLLDSHTRHSTNNQTSIDPPKVCSRTQSLLAHLQLPGLLRSDRLRADIRTLTDTPEHEIEEQLKLVSDCGRLAEFIAHTKQSVEKNPHVLLAYAWVLYMALFSGGRYLRASLKTAGGFEDFWSRDPSPVRPYSVTREAQNLAPSSKVAADEKVRPSARQKTRPECHQMMMKQGLSFFDFVGAEDGEDIKREFKKRIAEAEVLLTEGEKADVIQEAQAIFSFMVMIVTELDAVCGTTSEDLETVKTIQPMKLHKEHKPLNKSRSSITLAQERLSRTRDNDGSSSDDGKRVENLPNFLSSMIASPMAKLVRFKDGLPGAAIMPIGRKHLKDSSSSSEQMYDNLVDMEPSDGSFLGLVTVGGPLMALTAMFAAWYFVG
ncbi:hem oxygenase-like multi-helical protein [Rutstroemia sp. NJR-2017a BVV2]|nr:hem oxygenase-like multi-helical protein [Rutstroemia sp. NJR-2017a BVV2]PQE21819.1 hem oxygenase-like multi-helical protein [Rutstroemia sp. NJR-2017a BVV2]